ncbi:DUF3800 domain-containing protein [Pseudactinotalea suaedae]|uniref:DUF3800 domain-containing protein n=1 Tax=Pseudactinotalea suaedae TaxID=1524924 RepID=UPI0012E207F7|nr:DUF3800 domain-containing protein [Pseudactinotalea suaedae]
MSAAHPASDGFRLFYVDDSGSPNDGYIVYSWIEVTPGCWQAGLRQWLDLRKRLYANYSVPPSTELHATRLIGGRDAPAIAGNLNNSKALRRSLVQDALGAIGQNDQIALGTVCRHTSSRGRDYYDERGTVYGELTDHLNGRLTAADEYGVIFMDGDGSDQSYFQRHRDLPLATRRILEDPLFQLSHVSQWVQMADLVAWTTYQALNRHPGKPFAWTWYDDYLRQSDINGAPLRL